MAEPDPAASRFWLLQLTRLSGAAMVVVGALIVAEAIALPYALGIALLVLGLVEFFVIPTQLAKRWSSRDK